MEAVEQRIGGAQRRGESGRDGDRGRRGDLLLDVGRKVAQGRSLLVGAVPQRVELTLCPPKAGFEAADTVSSRGGVGELWAVAGG